MIHNISSHIELVAGAKRSVGEIEFNRRVEALKYTDWPARHELDSDQIHGQKCANHVAIVEQDVARQIIG